MIKPITNHIHPVTVEELETIHAHVNGTFAPSSIAKEREAYTSGQEASANLFELVAAAMPERNTKVLCNIDLSAPIEQLQAEIAALRIWAYGDDDTGHQQADMIPALTSALDAALEWIDAVPSEMPLPTMPGFDRDDVNNLLKEAKAITKATAAQEEQAPAGNFFIKFIAGNPAVFSKVRTNPDTYMTLDEAMEDFSFINDRAWRGWIEDKDGNRVKETTTETLWAKGRETSHD